ncbi:MAG: ATPase [Paracoccaceae bacterium]|nr:MAG: ATPase [Paracoccaceae bacterium]
MSGWPRKRFWAEARAGAVPGGGWTVLLDGRALKTPARAPLVLPSLPLAEAIAAEWQAQQAEVRPATMPLARIAHSAIDKVAPQAAAVAAELAGYGATDLLCYRASAPAELAARQAAAWDPLLAWAADHLSAPLRSVTGVMPVAQPPASLAALARRLDGLTPFQLSALHDLVAIPGSLVLGLAVAGGRLTAAAAFDMSRIDEHWQAELWGRDDEAAESEALKRSAHGHAARFFGLCGTQDC